MRLITPLLLLVCFAVSTSFAQQVPEPKGEASGGPPSMRRFEEVRRIPAPEARQGVAVDDDHFYAFSNFRIAKYDRRTGERVAQWEGKNGGPIIHLNSCSVVREELVCAHSNFPASPMVSSIEIWDRATLRHRRSHSLGIYEGSLTWAVRRDGEWWLHFAHYGATGGTPGKGPEWSTLVRFDDNWIRRAAFTYPAPLIEKFAPHSASGGGWAADGTLYVSGHDAHEIYVLKPPAMGSVLEWIETIPAPIEGQAWDFDPLEPDTIWGIKRSTGEVIVARLQK